ncbi:hypothetical protein BGX26_004249, partial [Mortierella sp. AD094]
MQTFAEFAASDRHGHSNFDKMYACFAAYVGRERKRGVTTAIQYEFNNEKCRKDYDDFLVRGTISCSSESATSIIRTSMQRHTTRVINGMTKSGADYLDRFWHRGQNSATTSITPNNRMLTSQDDPQPQTSSNAQVEGGDELSPDDLEHMRLLDREQPIATRSQQSESSDLMSSSSLNLETNSVQENVLESEKHRESGTSFLKRRDKNGDESQSSINSEPEHHDEEESELESGEFVDDTEDDLFKESLKLLANIGRIHHSCE